MKLKKMWGTHFDWCETTNSYATYFGKEITKKIYHKLYCDWNRSKFIWVDMIHSRYLVCFFCLFFHKSIWDLFEPLWIIDRKQDDLVHFSKIIIGFFRKPHENGWEIYALIPRSSLSRLKDDGLYLFELSDYHSMNQQILSKLTVNVFYSSAKKTWSG